MTFLKVLAIIILVLWLIGMIKVGISVSFLDSRLSVSTIFLGMHFSLFPKKKDEEESPPEEPPPEEPADEQMEKKPKKKRSMNLHLQFSDYLEILSRVLNDFGKIFTGLNFDKFYLYITVATPDPALTADVFGKVNLIINTLAPICSERFECRDLDVWTKADFNDVLPRIGFAFDLTLRLHNIPRRIDIVFDILVVLLKVRWRNFKLKITDPEEYEYEMKLAQERADRLSALFGGKDPAPQEGSASTEDDNERKIS